MQPESGSPNRPAAEVAEPIRAQTDLVEAAVTVLAALPAWQLTPARWEQAAAAVDILAESVRAGDVDAARQAVTQLLMIDPRRITKIGTVPRTPAPARVRERADSTRHALAGAPDQDRSGRGRSADRDGDDREPLAER